MAKDKVLLKDIIIPKGTILRTAPTQTKRNGAGHFDCTIGLSPNTSGCFEYYLDPDCSEELEDYFADVV